MRSNTNNIYLEASDSGLAPGHWPVEFVYRDARYTRTGAEHNDNGDLLAYIYTSTDEDVDTFTITIFND